MRGGHGRESVHHAPCHGVVRLALVQEPLKPEAVDLFGIKAPFLPTWSRADQVRLFSAVL